MGGSPYDPSGVQVVSGARSFVGLGLLCAIALGAGEEFGGSGGLPARIEVLDGRAKVALPDGVLNLSAGAPVQRFSGALRFEQAPESRTRIGWTSSASLLIEGKAALEWSPPDASGMPLAWDFAEVDRASLEVRRGRVRIELPGGWRGSLQPGAYTLRGLSGDSVEFHHAAGLPVTFWPPLQAGEPLPPYTVLPGAAVHLLGEARRPLALQGAADAIQEPHAKLGFEAKTEPASYPSWRDFAWPWNPLQSPAESQAAEPQPAAPVRPSPTHGPLGERLEPAPRPVESARASTGPTSMSPDESPATEQVDPPAEPASGPEAPAAEPAPVEETTAPSNGREVRRNGRLVLTPYGPRWIELEQGASAPASKMRRAFLRP